MRHAVLDGHWASALRTAFHAAARIRHLSRRTEKAYLGWSGRFVRFHGNRNSATLGRHEVEAFLNSLAVERKVAPSTQNQALAALLFLYGKVLDQELPCSTISSVRRSARVSPSYSLALKWVRSYCGSKASHA